MGSGRWRDGGWGVVLTVAGSRGSFGDGGGGDVPIAEIDVSGGEMGDGDVL